VTGHSAEYKRYLKSPEWAYRKALFYAFLTMEKESKLPAAAELVERNTGLRIMRPTTYWGLLDRWANLYY